MPVFKNKTQGQYVNVYKDILKNHSLSLRDRGMVVTLDRKSTRLNSSHD